MWTSAVCIILLCGVSLQLPTVTLTVLLSPTAYRQLLPTAGPSVTTTEPSPSTATVRQLATTRSRNYATSMEEEHLPAVDDVSTPVTPPAMLHDTTQTDVVPSSAADSLVNAQQQSDSQSLVEEVLHDVRASTEPLDTPDETVSSAVVSPSNPRYTERVHPGSSDSLLGQALDDVSTTPEPPAVIDETTLSAAISSSTREDVVRAHQSDSQSLAGQVLDELVTLCERRLKSSTTETIQQLSLKVDAVIIRQGEIEASLNSFSDRQNKIERDLENLAIEQQNGDRSMGSLRSDMQNAISDLSHQHTLMQSTTAEMQADMARLQEELGVSSNLVSEKQSALEQRMRVFENHTTQLIDDCFGKQQQSQTSLNNLSEQLLSINTSLSYVVSNASSQNKTIKHVSNHQTRISESLKNLTAVTKANEVSLRGILSEQDALQTSVVGLQTAVDENVLQSLNNVSNQQASFSDQLATVEAKIQILPYFLGYPCQNGSQCRLYVSNSTCGSNGRCACAEGFRQTSDSATRCERLHLGYSCSSNAQCSVNNAVCSSGRCRCRDGFWNRESQECRANMRKDDLCKYDGDCATAGGTCVNGRCACSSRTVAGYEYRMQNGPSCKEGRVEMRRTGGLWGYVCDDYFEAPSAKVLCRSLGFTGGESLCCSKYGGFDNFHMDDVKCRGAELHLMGCTYYGWGRDDCSSNEVVSVRCD